MDQDPGVIPIEELIACVKREIKMREFVYPKRVQEKKMSQAKADHEIACMRAILARILIAHECQL